LTGESHNIDIGNQGNAGESNVTRIGDSQSKAFIAGISGATIGGPAVPVLVNGNGQLGVTTSSRRFKRDIQQLGPSTADGLMKLRPVSFRYRPSVVHGPWPLQFGLIAEQVAKIFPNLVAYGPDGKPDAIAYQELPALLLAEIQRQQREISWLMHRVRGAS
jgi:hypothetical protein